MSERRAALWILAAALVVTVAGWRLFWFLTDDAYIAFRYAANWLAGWGPTWNPPPFRPVEGYTDFLWVALLAGVWKITGVSPPVAANYLSLACGCGTLAVIYRLVRRMELPGVGPRGRLALLGLAMLGTVTNRTYLAWLSSGLETALFNLCLTWWIYEALTRPAERGRWWGPRLSTAAALAALTRPDGLLAVAGTLVLLAWPAPADGPATRHAARPGVRLADLRRRAAAAMPLGAVLAHVLWRRAYYGAWLPNTFYAKTVDPWPESGVRYAASFAVENGAWAWLLLALAAGVAWALRGGLAGRRPAELLRRSAHVAVPLAVLAAHVLYYTLITGGDHFEYRVLSHLVPLMFASGAWLAARLSADPWRPALALALVVAVSWPIPWVHWAATRHLVRREQTLELIVPIHGRFPWPLRPVVARWDSWQAWLIERFVGMRHQEHKVFPGYQSSHLPTREEGSRLRWEDRRPVVAAQSVGVVGWVLPGAAVIDMFGLNDAVIARNPTLRAPREARHIAHVRQPPPGYLACFQPNVRRRPEGGLEVMPRPTPLTDERIRDCEERAWY